jgi:hypothetical protein
LWAYQLVPLPRTRIDHPIATPRHHELLLPGSDVSDHASLVLQDFGTLWAGVALSVVVAAIGLDAAHVTRRPTHVGWGLLLP